MSVCLLFCALSLALVGLHFGRAAAQGHPFTAAIAAVVIVFLFAAWVGCSCYSTVSAVCRCRSHQNLLQRAMAICASRGLIVQFHKTVGVHRHPCGRWKVVKRAATKRVLIKRISDACGGSDTDSGDSGCGTDSDVGDSGGDTEQSEL
eukprot:gnl/TRDRNA2_/TRDRNA2_107967_c2_seq1.p1 gnl/TRDRNA2_/TRDRNA2_107967_c2~~gnl/TRDRNA2_/TRDRNA2_107967_c2_seq1.p1  ORF type:complete len:148 (-),score=17.13 gnl/TRDRNA2_/TRDRNA2_107967_c2_seq1:24-467(-)